VASSPNLFKRVFLPTLLLFVVLAFIAYLVADPGFRGYFDPDFVRQWWRVGQVMELAHQNYLHPDKVAYDKLADSALDHVLDGLDRYTVYMDPADYQDFLREGEQRFVGVGVELDRRDGRVEVTRVFPDSPADKDGWKPGDSIVNIDETVVRDFSVNDVANLLRGVANSVVNVTRQRPGVNEQLNGNLTRGGFDIPSIRDVELRPDGVGYMRLTQFGVHSGEEFADSLHDLMARQMRGLVLDLRDNPGGLLTATVDVLEPLLPPGTLVVTTRGRDGQEDGSFSTTGRGNVHYNGPLVVLVNDNSASAAEIVTGALQDWKRAVIVGERTFGKGVVQEVFDLPDGAGVKLTTEAYFLPHNRSIQDVGVQPDVPIALSDEQRAELHLQKMDSRHLSDSDFAAYYGFPPQPDPQLETAAGLILAARR
jgi:carboxyl-terminal processing protease